MKAQTRVNPWWAALTVWGVVNAVNVLQAAGFLSRVYTRALCKTRRLVIHITKSKEENIDYFSNNSEATRLDGFH